MINLCGLLINLLSSQVRQRARSSVQDLIHRASDTTLCLRQFAARAQALVLDAGLSTRIARVREESPTSARRPARPDLQSTERSGGASQTQDPHD